MPIESVHRGSDSPYIARVWSGQASGIGTMTSVATSTWELVFWEDHGGRHAAVRGPETAAVSTKIIGDSASFGITFAHGTSMPLLPIAQLVDGEIESPSVTGRTFVLDGAEWEIPQPDSAEQFVQKLVSTGALVRDPVVNEVVWGGIAKVGSRSVQRRVATATGLSQGTIRQIERARHAAVLLGEGVPAMDVVHRSGYYDQPHLARSLRRFIGRTATQLQQSDERAAHDMSLLYKPEREMSS